MARTEPAYSLAGRRVWVAGHRGLVGSAIHRRLAREECEVLTVGRSDVDLRRQTDVEDWLADQRPDAVIVAAAKVGGILANSTQPAEFLYDNLAIEANIIEGARRTSVAKLVFLGSSCIYPKLAPQPMPESAMLTGPLEPTNEWYAIAKIAGIKMCQAYRAQYGSDFISAMPTNLYGPGDNFDLASSHVLPALMRKVHEAKAASEKTVEIWGSGKPLREFLYVDDCADAIIYLLKHYSGNEHVNVGSGEETSIAALARTIADVIGYGGKFHYDKSKPDGMPRKLLDVARLSALGWSAQTSLTDGIRQTYAWYLEHRAGEAA
jgi:GDP-L-fucose synthase